MSLPRPTPSSFTVSAQRAWCPYILTPKGLPSPRPTPIENAHWVCQLIDWQMLWNLTVSSVPVMLRRKDLDSREDFQ